MPYGKFLADLRLVAPCVPAALAALLMCVCMYVSSVQGLLLSLGLFALYFESTNTLKEKKKKNQQPQVWDLPQWLPSLIGSFHPSRFQLSWLLSDEFEEF